MKRLHLHIWQTLRHAHTWAAVLVFTLTPLLFLAHAEVYTEQGKRYYRCFGADFRLENGRLSDAQAKKILRYVQDSYENDRINKHMLDIWHNTDDLYDEGEYHGKIMLTIFKTYLNVAFDGYHNQPLSFSPNSDSDRYRYEELIPGFAWHSWGCGGLTEVWCANDKKIAWYGFNRHYKFVPSLEKLVDAGQKACTHRGAHYTEGCFRSRSDAAFHAWKLTSKRNSKEKIVANSTGRSASNIVDAVQYIYETVSFEDNIFASGSYDHTLSAIIEQFPNTHRRYGDLVSRSLYSKIANKIYSFIYGKCAKQKMLEVANKYKLQIQRPSAREKAF